MVWVEAEFAVERVNGDEVTRALLLQMAVSAQFSKKAMAAFKKKLKALSGG